MERKIQASKRKHSKYSQQLVSQDDIQYRQGNLLPYQQMQGPL